MIDTLAISVIIGGLALGAVSVVIAMMNRPVGMPLLVALGVGELALLVQVVLAIVKLAGGERPDGGMPTFIGYLIGSLLILPLAALLGLGERSRWGTAVVAGGFLVIAVLTVRMQQVWQVSGG